MKWKSFLASEELRIAFNHLMVISFFVVMFYALSQVVEVKAEALSQIRAENEKIPAVPFMRYGILNKELRNLSNYTHYYCRTLVLVRGTLTHLFSNPPYKNITNYTFFTCADWVIEEIVMHR